MSYEIGDLIAPLLGLIIKMFETGVCPCHFKTAVVKLLYKSGDRELPKNYSFKFNKFVFK